jgi:thiol:disulfide interchange protein DsbD
MLGFVLNWSSSFLYFFLWNGAQMLEIASTLTLQPARCNQQRLWFKQLLLILAFVWQVFPMPPAMALTDPFTEPLDSLNKLKPEHVVQFKVVELQSQGSRTSAVIELDTRKGFKVYEKGLLFSYKSEATLNTPVRIDYSANPAARVVQDPFYNEPRGVYDRGVRYNVVADFRMDETGELLVRFEACSVNTCLLPTHFTMRARVGETSRPEPKTHDTLGLPPNESSLGVYDSKTNLTPVAPPPTLATSPSQQSPEKPEAKNATASLTDTVTLRVQQALGQNSWMLFPVLFLAGLLMNLTPCIYPMIPITLNVLGHTRTSSTDSGQAEHHPVAPALIYVLGIVLSYALMGVVAGMTGSLFGGLLQNKIVHVALAAIMFALGLTMLGVIDVSRIQNLGNRIPLSKQSPRLGIFTMGAVSGLVAAPCTGPVLSLLLVLIGQTKDPVFGFTLMSVFAAGFGAPYLALGLLSQRLKRLPRAGRLMLLVKNIFAALMFALSLYYLKSLLTGSALATILYVKPSASGAIAIIIASVLFLLWQMRSPDKPMALYGTQIGLTLLALWLTLGAINGFIPADEARPLLMTRAEDPNAQTQPTAALEVQRINWQKDWNKAVETARRENKGLIVDAWAQWCVACLQMDADVWVDPQVVQMISERFVPVKIDFTESNPQSDRLAEQWDLAGLPAVGVYPAGSKFTGIPPLLYREAVTTEKLNQGIEKLLNQKPE